MSIEETLSSIDASLKTLVTISQTFGAARAELGQSGATTEAAATKTRTKKGDADKKAAFKLVDGDPEGTRYFVIAKHNTAARVLPGETVPSIEGTVEVGGDEFLAKKEEFAKNAATSQGSATGSNAATTTATGAAAASGASSPEATVSFKQVVDKLMALSKDTRPGKGRDAITAFLAKHGKTRVPELEALGKHAELLAEVEALLAPDVEIDPFA